MAARKKSAKPPKSAVPEYITQSRTYQRKRVTKRKLPSFEEAMFLLHVPELARAYFEALYEGVKLREKTPLEHVGEMLNYVQRKGFNINVAQQMMQQTVAAGPESPVVGCDAFIRRLAEAREGRALPAPADVIDVSVRPADTVAVEGERGAG